MERQALPPEAVIIALRDDFPSLQLVTIIGTDGTENDTATTTTPPSPQHHEQPFQF